MLVVALVNPIIYVIISIRNDCIVRSGDKIGVNFMKNNKNRLLAAALILAGSCLMYAAEQERNRDLHRRALLESRAVRLADAQNRSIVTWERYALLFHEDRE